MEALLMAVLSDLIANGIVTISIFVGERGLKVARHLMGKDDVLRRSLEKAAKLAIKATGYKNKREMNKLTDYISSPEAEAIVRQLFATQMVEEDSDVVSSIRSEFHSSLSLFLGLPKNKTRGFSGYLFAGLVDGTKRALEI